MSEVVELLARLRELDIRLWEEEGRLRYSAPEGKLDQELRAQLVERRDEVVEFLRRAGEAGKSHGEAIVAGAGGSESAVSFTQQRLLFLEQLVPGTAVYHIALAVRLKGELDLGALEWSLGEVVGRHEVLRTAIRMEDGRPALAVLPEWSGGWVVEDLSGAGESEIPRLALEEARRGFDLERGPLLRARVLRLGAADHVLLVTVHHVAFDGWSQGVLRRELGTYYRARVEGKRLQVAPLAIQYRDFAAWQRKWMSGGVLEGQLSYWVERLAGAPQVLDLPTDRARPATRSLAGARERFGVTREMLEGIEELSRREGVTPFIVLLAAYYVLLGRYAAQEDLVVGMPIANRNRAEVEGLIGFFVNTLALRVDLAGDPTFRELLGRVREAAMGAYAHQDLPFEVLVDKLQVKRDLSRNPLFQVAFDFLNMPLEPMALVGLQEEWLDTGAGTSMFDLMLMMEPEEGKGLAGLVEYSTDLFEVATIRRLIGHYQNILRQVVEDPSRRIGDISLLSGDERQRMLHGWNETGTDYPSDGSIHGFFEEQAGRTPDAAAIVFGGESISYGELNRRANRLARRLQDAGLETEALVGICLNRSIEMVVALLGVLKAGGAYVPLDPAYPRERLGFMVDDARMKVVISQREVVERLPALTACRLMCLDDQRGDEEGEVETPSSKASGEDLAYVIYTSGSTGRPKGVAITHRSAVALIHWASGVFDAEDLAGVVAATSICFDLSVFELFVPLSRGGTVILANSIFDLPVLAEGGRVTLVNTVPSAMRELVRAGGLPASLRVVNLAGEPLSAALVQDIHRLAPTCRVYDLYGPTEDTTYSTWALRKPDGPATIGRPISNTRLYVLDTRMNPVPVGTPGELYIGGQGLARGYLGRPDITAERFVPDPFCSEAGRRMYKTGDLVRYLSDGNVEYLGRLDHQVKIRGFRIELGEVESSLVAHPEVEEAVVVAREGPSDGRRLVGYVVLARENGVSVAELLDHLRARLPEYMVPSTIVVLDDLPLTPNGKVDRRALPEPGDVQPERSVGFVAPRTALEKELAAIWSEILGLERIGIHDDFFELGGDSLLAARTIARVREASRSDISIRAPLEARTIARLAALVESSDRLVERSAFVIPRADAGGRYPLSLHQERLWFLCACDPGNPAYTISFRMRMHGELDVEALTRSLQSIVDRHEILRTTFVQEGDRVVQVVSPHLHLSVPVVDIGETSEPDRAATVDRLSETDNEHPFDLAVGPLVRTTLVRLSDSAYVLLVSLHHIISDGGSINLFLKELSVAYQSRVRGAVAALPSLEIQYGDFARWQCAMDQEDVLSHHAAYWREKLGNVTGALELATDFPRPPVKTYAGDTLEVDLSEDLAASLTRLGHEHGCTLYMTLLAIFEVLLHRLSGQADILVGAPVDGRRLTQVENLIGFFLNTVVFRADLSGDPSFLELLQRIRNVTLEAYEHQDLPFERVLQIVQPKRDLSRTPLFQVFFNMYSLPDEALPMSGIRVEEIVATDLSCLFDLTLYAIEQSKRIRFRLVYNTDLFGRERMKALLEQLHAILLQILERPKEAIGSYSLITPGAKASLPDPALPLSEPKHELVTDRVSFLAARRPELPALQCGTQEMTYAELERRSRVVARALMARGLQRGDAVAVIGWPSMGLIVGLLGVFYAGGCLVALDPRLPPARHRLMMDAARVRFALDVDGCLLRDGVENPSIALDSEGRLSSGPEESGSKGAALPVVLPDDPAYVFFTSGTTGVPKGILGSHKGLAHFLSWQRTTFSIGPGDRCAQLTGLSFDVVLREIFTPLTSGATLCLPDKDDVNALDVLPWLEHQEISVVHTVPTLAGAWLADVPAGFVFPRLRRVFFAGEPLTGALVRRWREVFSKTEDVVNLYGPTETTLAKCYYRVPDPPVPGVQPLGFALPETQALVLNDRRQLCGIGEPGEIAIRTPFRSLGYVNAPEENRRRFVRNPFRNDDRDVIYLTSDRARYRPDGMLEFLGRLDGQVKINGVRVELREIETVVGQFPGVREVVVLAIGRDENAVEKRLVAYVSGTRARDQFPAELRRFLLEKLPFYMVPSSFVHLDRMPVTPNGKIDRQALAAMDAVPEVHSPNVEPRDEIEENIASAWKRALGTERVSVHDNFFDLGGHSLLTMRVQVALKRTFGYDLSIIDFFEFPTISALARRVAGRADPGGEAEVRVTRERLGREVERRDMRRKQRRKVRE